MLIPVRGVLVHARSGTELSRVRTEFRLRLLEPSNKSPLESRGADIVTQSSYALAPLARPVDKNPRPSDRVTHEAATRSPLGFVF
jgi:hypothetical protein